MTVSMVEADKTWTEWRKELPAGWAALELRRVAEISASNVDKISQEGEIAVRLCNYTDAYYNDVIEPDLKFMEATATPSEVARFRLRGGEVLLTKDSETAEDIAIPAYVMSGLEDVVCGYHLYLLRPHPDKVDGRFLMRACSVSPVKDQFVTAANGITRFGLGQQDLGSSLVPVPPLHVQRNVAEFLDRETAKIDCLIKEKQRLIELLEEKRAALITRCVTKGLDPAVEMKDSGVERLGEMPAHWRVVRLRYLVLSLEQGWSPNSYQHEADEDEWGVLKAGSVNQGIFRWSEHKALPASELPRPELEVSQGDLLMSRASGSPDLIGSVAVVDDCRSKLMLSDKLYRIRVRQDQVQARYLSWALAATPTRSQIFLSISGAGGLANNLAQSDVKDLLIAVPPLEEQDRICSYLESELWELAQLVQASEEGMNLLREYRTALISAAVTGKIDVREHAA